MSLYCHVYFLKIDPHRIRGILQVVLKGNGLLYIYSKKNSLSINNT
jgi:hypothetical protein